MLSDTHNTIRGATLRGRVCKQVRTVAPGRNSSVKTPGTGAMGEWMRKRMSEEISAVTSQRIVGPTRAQNSLVDATSIHALTSLD